MEKVKNQSSSSEDIKVIHIKVLGGSHADIHDIGIAMQKFRETLPYRLEAIITDETIELESINVFIRELFKLKKEIEEKQFLERGKNNDMSNMQK